MPATSFLLQTAMQSAVLSFLSNLIAQTIRLYQQQSIPVLNSQTLLGMLSSLALTPAFQFGLFAFLDSIPLTMWQLYVEKAFLGRSARSVACKVGLDQALVAPLNTLAVIGGLGVIQGLTTGMIVSEIEKVNFVHRWDSELLQPLYIRTEVVACRCPDLLFAYPTAPTYAFWESCGVMLERLGKSADLRDELMDAEKKKSIK
ncbi:hypothetical protein G7K_3136-t1 [Saitoella complicata NRRL Y-17804]|uniref:Uncharacterized protein n=1 Tax=Saitoella complicata (strain BCRC 22490 / CBS 7301 / JCM 7358 / NBRC 10748 / NRRL Y-17804) TaxID=698492 RepID=A0A0E9NHU2_SAICN|nr:hypothetical protein G7K_3136-t1 [Saitoella complicata NRRL Y-17804]